LPNRNQIGNTNNFCLNRSGIKLVKKIRSDSSCTEENNCLLNRRSRADER